MKKVFALALVIMLTGSLFSLNGQVLNPRDVIKRQGTNRTNDKIEDGVDAGFDKIESGIGGLFSKDKNEKNSEENKESGKSSSSSGTEKQSGLFPADGASGVSIPVTFKWEPVTADGFKTKGYEFYICKEGEVNDQMLGGPGKNEFTTDKLEPNTTYTWHVVASDGDGYMPGPGGTFTTGEASSAVASMNINWAKYDFVPGDEVIFEDGPDIMEENGEFPSRWDLVGGVVEIAHVDGNNVVMFRDCDYSQGIVPYLENSDEDYLPDVFTLEFDCFFDKGYSGRYFVYFYDRKNQKYSGEGIDINVNSLELGDSEQVYPGKEHGNSDETGGWRHISVAFTKGKMKCYMDDTRLINIPHYEGNPTGLSISAEVYSNDEVKKFIKNVRIAKGGVKYYDRVLSEGKIICNGIRFDVNKSTLKPESMGSINEIFELMQKQTDIRFSVEGHTDSDGDDAKNQTLSEERAKTVMNQLVRMGIAADRLKYQGFGESMPLDNNTTPEGKANNRRVEFVKF